MFALSRKNSLVGVNGLVFDQEHNVTEGRVVYYFAHVCYQRVYSFVVNFIFFEFANVQNTDIVEPLAPVKAAKYEKLLHTDHTCGVALTTSWCFLIFYRVRPSH